MDVPPSDDEILNPGSNAFRLLRIRWSQSYYRIRETNGFVLAVLSCPSAMSQTNPLAPGNVARSPPSPLGLVHIREPFFLLCQQTITTRYSPLVAVAHETCNDQNSISKPFERHRREQFSL